MENLEKSPLWKEALYPALEAARAGRQVLLQYFGRLEHIEEKFQAGLVSEADKESEKAIFDLLRKKFPKDEFLGEESVLDLKTTSPKAKRRWIVDPLDGTTNYIHRFPIFAISIGYEVDGEIQVAVIDVPLLNETFTAVKGCGAYLNGRRLQISQTSELKSSLFATGFFGEQEDNLNEQLRIFSDLVRVSRGIRRPGAAAYDLAMVAKGVFDGYWEKGIKPWDSAAGILLVREAGGVVKTYRGEEYHPFSNSIVAGNSTLVEKTIHRMQPHLLATTD